MMSPYFRRACFRVAVALTFEVAHGAEPVLSVSRLTATTNGVSLQWAPAGTNSNYVVQRRRQFGDDLWIAPRGPVPWPIPDTNWTDAAPPTGANGFYRVVALPPVSRGQLVKVGPPQIVNKGTIQFLLSLLGVTITPQFDVQIYKLDYLTPDAHGLVNQASGVVVVPAGAAQALPLVTYQHGTLTRTNDAPSASSWSTSYELDVGVVFAATGYIAVLPDYLGLGDSPGFHPYHDAAAEATAGVDMLRAARSFCVASNIAWNNQLFLCGYSQGGHAAAALQRELEAYHTNEFTITASALMAGAYDLSGVTATDMLSDRAQPDPYYFAYLLAAYQSVYHFASSLADLFAPPYDSTLPPLFNGNTSGGDINAAMPAQPWKVLKPEYLAAFKADPLHPLWVALRNNDLLDWAPRAPTRLYHCSGDLDVIPANSQVAQEAFAARGVTVDLIDPMPGADHSECAVPALLSAKAWFDSKKQ